MTANEWHFAIDFGTSNTSAAHTSPMTDAVETLSLSHRNYLMPSAVFMEGYAGDHTYFTGDTALSRGRREPARMLLSPKRYIDHEIVSMAGQDVSLKDIIASVIGAALERGKAQHAGTAPSTVTVTHPEAWSIHAIEHLIAGVEAAGIDKRQIRTISEPQAAAMHYAAQQHVDPGNHVAVFDFGGGTLDIAVLQAQEDSNFRVVSVKGDNSLGGRTVDTMLFRWVLQQLEHDDPDFADELKNAPITVMHSLEENIREAKEILSDASSATITISTPEGERDLLITRDEFNDLIDPMVTRAVELTQAALAQSGVDTDQTPIYLTGGSSRIPHVQNRLNAVGNVMTLDDPKTVVSRGALLATLCGFNGDAIDRSRQGRSAARPAAGIGVPGTNGQVPNASVSGEHESGASGIMQNPLRNLKGAQKAVLGAAAVASSGLSVSRGWGKQVSVSKQVPLWPRDKKSQDENAQSESQYGANSQSAHPQSSNPFAHGATSQPTGPQQSAPYPSSHAAKQQQSSQPMNFHGAAQPLTSSNSSQGGKSGFQTKLVVILVAAIVLIAGGTWGYNSLFGDKYKGIATANEGVSSPLFNVFPDSRGFVPKQFAERVSSCSSPREDSSATVAVEGYSDKFYSCYLKSEGFSGEQTGALYTSSRSFLEGESAKKAHEYVTKSEKVDNWVFQKAGGGRPEIIYSIEKDGGSSPDAAITIYYPDKQFFSTSKALWDDRGRVEAMSKFYGFSK